MADATIPSKYLPIWTRLKAEGVCRITAPLDQHRVIIKMVRRRRDKDLAFLYNLTEQHRTHEIKVSRQGTVITFTLHIKLKPIGV